MDKQALSQKDPLEKIVVEVSRDRGTRRTGCGTGFYISENEIATCYHVLVPHRCKLKKKYWVRHDSWRKWVEAEPIREKCHPLPDDVAILRLASNIEVPSGLKFKAFDNPSKFRSRGYEYDEQNENDFGATEIEGNIICPTTLYEEKSPRLQLETPAKTIKEGRSGSPIFSVYQNAIVGMIDYQGGMQNWETQKVAAIPVEAIMSETQLSSQRELGEHGYVPELPPNFLKPSEDLKAIKGELLVKACQKTAITGISKFGLHGMGGLGKSVLAAALARDKEVRHHFSDGIFWLTLRTNPRITQLQSNLAKMLDSRIHSFNDEENGRAILSSLITDKNCLIILDDVWHADHAKSMLSDMGPRSKMLITTRDASVITALGAEKYELSLFSDIRSSELLAKWAGQDMVKLPIEAQEIIRECGRLPLALAICGALAKDGVPWKDLLEDLKESKLESIDHEYDSVMRSMEISIKMLPPNEARCYRELVVFSQDEPIPSASIINFWAYANALTKRGGRRLLADLNQKSLIQNIEKNGENHIKLHPLQYDFLKAICKNIPNIHRILLEAYRNRTSEGNWCTGPDDGYFFQHLPYHLSEAEREIDLKCLLLNIKWLQAKLQATDSYELIMDYNLLKSKEDLLLVQEAIRLSAHILARDPGQLKSQLLARLIGFDSRSIQELLGQIPESSYGIWLRPMIASLTTPGGPLIKTVKLQIGSINAIAITPNSQKVMSSSDNTLMIWDLETGRELQVLRRDNAQVNTIAITPDGRKAVSGSGDSTLTIWDLETGEELQILKGHTDSVNAVAITADGQKVVSGSGDKTLKVWDLETGKELKVLFGHTDSVSAVAITADGQKAVSGSGDKTLKVWDLETGKELKILSGHTDSVSAVAVTADGQKAVSGSGDKTLKVWDLGTGKELQILMGHTDWIYTVTTTSDGQMVVSGSYDKTLKVWDLKKSIELQTLSGHTRSVNIVSVNPDDRTAISGSDDGTLKVWNIRKDQKFSTLPWHKSWVKAVSVTPDCRKAISGSEDGTIKIWDLENGQELQTLNGHKDWINALAITPNGKMIISVSADTTIKVWDMETGKELHTLQGHENYVNVVAITPDGRKIVSGSGDGTLRIWDIETGKELLTLKEHSAWINAIAITPDGKKAISGSDDGTLRVWDLELGREIRGLQSHIGPISILVITSDGKTVVSGSIGGFLEFWDLETGITLKTVRYRNDPATAVFIGFDGKKVVSCSNEEILEVWDLETCRIIAKFIGEVPMTSITIASDKITIVAGDGLGHVHFLRLEDSGHLFNKNFYE